MVSCWVSDNHNLGNSEDMRLTLRTGFGEIFARDWLGPFFGFTARNNAASNDPSSRKSTFSTSGLGLRNAGKQRGGGQDVPGHAAAKTAIETVAESAVGGTSGA